MSEEQNKNSSDGIVAKHFPEDNHAPQPQTINKKNKKLLWRYTNIRIT